MVEVQALTATGFPGAVKRKAAGIDASRLAMLIAVLEQHGGLRLSDRDVFTSAVGGIKITEPAADLAIALAIAGAHYKRALAERTCVMGEIGLGSEVRGVHQLEGRLSEAANLGFKRAVVPAMNAEMARKFAKRLKMDIAGVKNFGEAMGELG
jgi:DNA repair protein RadA/Sms